MITQCTGIFKPLLFNCGSLLAKNVFETTFDVAKVRWCLHSLNPKARAGLIDEVNRFIGKVAVGNVTISKVGRSNDGLVGDRYPVMRFVLVAHALENLNGVGQRWLFNLHRLEATLESGIFLNVLAVLIKGGGSNRLEFTTSQHWLQDRRCIDCALCGTGAHKGMNFIDKQNNVAASIDLLENFLQALFEVASITRAGDE